MAIVLTLAAVSAACGTSSNVEPLGITVQDGRELHLAVTCASEVRAEARELEDEVRVDNVSGEFIDGDCMGSVVLVLERPLGTRELVVEGNTWHDVGRDCPYGEFGPGDVSPPDSCSLVP
jgi:hypothetical protein